MPRLVNVLQNEFLKVIPVFRKEKSYPFFLSKSYILTLNSGLR